MGQNLPDEMVLSSPAQWRAISSSVRLQMVDLLRMLGPSAVPRLAEALDRPADGLYHHVRILERAGIVRRVGSERVGPRMQAVYSIAAMDVRLPIDRSNAKNAKQLARVTASVLRTAERGVAAALRRGGLTQNGPERNLWCRIHTGKVDPKRLARLNALLKEIEVEMDAGRHSGDGTTMTLVMTLWPATRGRRYDGATAEGGTKSPRNNDKSKPKKRAENVRSVTRLRGGGNARRNTSE